MTVPSTVPAVLAGESKRDYAVRLGLAQPTRGRMSRDAHAAIDAAVAAGAVFVEAVKPAPASARPTATVASTPLPAVAPRPSVQAASKDEAKIIRAWAKTQDGLTVGDRGRLHSDVVAAYRAAHGDAPATTVVVRRPTPNDMPQRTNIRGLATANGITHVQDTCGRCSKTLPMCQPTTCPQGPMATGGVKGPLVLV